jgi:hypothetical protein
MALNGRIFHFRFFAGFAVDEMLINLQFTHGKKSTKDYNFKFPTIS